MTRPRLTLTRIALAGAGVLTAAGIGAATIPAALASAPAAATSAVTTPSGTAPAPGPSAQGQRKGGRTTLRRLGVALRRMLVEQTAIQTGMTVQQVRAALRSGRSLDAVAGARARSIAGAVLADLTRRLDTARSQGRITQAQETRLLARAGERIATVMAATPRPRAPRAAPTPAV